MTIHPTTTSAPRLGLGVTDLTRALMDRLNLGREVPSVLIAEVAPGSLAEASNLHAGDVLLSIDGHAVGCAGEALERLHRARLSGTRVVQLLVEHAREIRQIPLCLHTAA
jgi:S1-C subfamily serine protease